MTKTQETYKIQGTCRECAHGSREGRDTTGPIVWCPIKGCIVDPRYGRPCCFPK